MILTRRTSRTLSLSDITLLETEVLTTDSPLLLSLFHHSEIDHLSRGGALWRYEMAGWKNSSAILIWREEKCSYFIHYIHK